MNHSTIMEEDEAVSNLGKLAANIAYYNFEWRFITLVIFNTIQGVTCVESFLSNYNKSIILKMGKFVPRHHVEVSQYVIFSNEATELTNILRWLVNSKYDNTGMYIIVCSSTNNAKCNEQEVFQTLSRIYIVNVVFIKRSEDYNEPLIFTYYPVVPGKCSNNIPERLNMNLNCHNDSCKYVFPEKFKNLHRCRFVISTVEQPPFMYLHNGTKEPTGGDGDIIKLVADILNATLIIKTPEDNDWGHYKNDNWTGSLGDVYNMRAHASMCSIPLTPHKYGNFQISFPYYSMDIVWVTRLPSLKQAWEKLLYPLKLCIRITILLMFIGIITINTFMKTKRWNKVRKVLNIAQLKSNLLFHSWIIFLGMSVLRLPTKSALRTTVFGWMWLTYILRCGYQATLIDVIKHKIYDDYFIDIKDALNNGYLYGGSSSLKEYYTEEADILSKWKYVNISEAYNVLDNLMDGKSDFVLAFNKQNILNRLIIYNATKRLQILPEKILNSPSTLFFKRYAPLRARVSHILSILVEAGFTEMLHERYLDRGNYLFRHSTTYQGSEALSLSHFTGSFMILLAGWFLSAIYFAVEMFFKPNLQLR